MEAAAVDGASSFQTFLRFGLPLGAPGILSAVVLGFLEYWNAIEDASGILKKTRRFGRCHYICQTSRRITPGYH
mgnify:CR=1 FL=1